MIVHSNTTVFQYISKLADWALAYMVLYMNIKLFFVENHIIKVELYIGLYVQNIYRLI